MTVRAIDVGVFYYGYPEDDADPGLDFVELYGNYSYEDLTVGVAYSPDYFAETDSFFYVHGEYSFALAENLSLDLHLGFNIFDDKEAGAGFGIGEVGDPKDQYIDYAIGLSTSAMGVDWGLAGSRHRSFRRRVLRRFQRLRRDHRGFGIEKPLIERESSVTRVFHNLPARAGNLRHARGTC